MEETSKIEDVELVVEGKSTIAAGWEMPHVKTYIYLYACIICA
jgi:hypothetical protein